MIKRKALTLFSLLLTGILFALSPLLQPDEPLSSDMLSVTRVWLMDDEPAVGRWLKKQAAQYEKSEKERVYIRTASREEIENALSGAENAIIPDLIISQGLAQPLLFRGYALIIRDEQAKIITPAPTSALFYRPTAAPGPSPAPAPAPDFSSIAPILIPAFLSSSLPGCTQSADPFSAFSAGKSPAAVLTAGQAMQLSFGYRAHPLPDKEGLLAVNANAMTLQGEKLLSRLQINEAQQALAAYGLYSFNPSLHLYDESDPIRAMIEKSRK